jgi:uncharacterized membrane protein
MKFNNINKNFLSALVFILLIIYFIKFKSLSLFYKYPLGIFIQIGFIIMTSYINPVFGIVTVLLMIIMLKYNINNFENFTSETLKNTTVKKVSKTAKPKIKNVAQEGFDLIGREDIMRKSKHSNTMPVNVSRSSENAEPFTGFDGIYTSY